MEIVLGLTAAICWGVADFTARFASRRIGAYRTLMIMQLFGFAALTFYIWQTGGFAHGLAWGWRAWSFAVFAGLLNAAASLSFYHSLETGMMTVVGPVSSAYPALTVVLALLSGERLHGLRGPGIAVTFVGVILAAVSFTPSSDQQASAAESAPQSKPRLSKGVGWAIGAATGFGFMFWWLGFHVVRLVGGPFSVWVIRLSSFVVLLFAAAPVKQSLRLPPGSIWWLLAALGVMDTTAFVATDVGLGLGHVSVVSVLASLYGAVTVLLSWIFLREHMGRTQWLGIALIFVGVVLVSL